MNSSLVPLEVQVNQLERRSLPSGGFSDHPKGTYRSDATAWAVLVLDTSSPGSNLVQQARTRLAEHQFEDGRVSIGPDHPEAFWPTPLAMFAWHGSPAHQKVLVKAVKFLLHTQGVHWERNDRNTIIGHDPSIPGWPWIDKTHSWVQPTALIILALSLVGHQDHSRVKDGIRLLLNRQLSLGGWNYGNTTVFDQELRPFPESTGLALNALAGRVPRYAVQKSLAYLNSEVSRLRTPLSLGWAIHGLKAWHIPVPFAQEWGQECLSRESRYGGYDTGSLSVLLSALLAPAGLGSLWEMT